MLGIGTRNKISVQTFVFQSGRQTINKHITKDGKCYKNRIKLVISSSSESKDSTSSSTVHALETEMATHSRVLAWRIPGTGEPGGLLSMGSHRVGHD